MSIMEIGLVGRDLAPTAKITPRTPMSISVMSSTNNTLYVHFMITIFYTRCDVVLKACIVTAGSMYLAVTIYLQQMTGDALQFS